jgi:hypothetical protein
MKAAPDRCEVFKPKQELTLVYMPLFTADDLRAVETSCKEQVNAIHANAQAVCREQWKGAVLIGCLVGAAVYGTLDAVVKFFSF